MDDYLLVCTTLLIIGLLLFVLGRMRIVTDKFYVPLLLSSFIFWGFYGVKIWREFTIPLLGFSGKLNSLLFYDYGNGLLCLFPLTLAILFIGKFLIKIDYKEQWGGTTTFNFPSLTYGIMGGIILSAIPLLIVALMGQKFNYKIDFYRYGINCITNLYEEIICRGLLLACCVRYWNRISAVVWTSVVFGLAHGLNEKSTPIAFAACLMAWVVLKAKSLWAGWTTHQLTDMIVDTLLP